MIRLARGRNWCSTRGSLSLARRPGTDFPSCEASRILFIGVLPRQTISESQVNLLKWACLFMQAICALVAIAMVQSDNRLASIIAMGIFATCVAASMLLILAHDRPFTGEISIKPDPLLQVMPEIAGSR